MKYAIDLYNEYRYREIVVDIPDINIEKLDNFCEEHGWSSEELVIDLIETFIKSRGL